VGKGGGEVCGGRGGFGGGGGAGRGSTRIGRRRASRNIERLRLMESRTVRGRLTLQS
jgi:hypothetical protein